MSFDAEFRKKAKLGLTNISVQTFDRPADAPRYDKPDWSPAVLEKAVIVGRGTTQGNPTIDLQFVDENGVHYIAMITANLLRSVLATADAVKVRTDAQEAAN